MPKITELPAAQAATATDLLPASQNGTSVRISRAQITAGLKSDVVSAPNRLLGRVAPGQGPIEEIGLGQGLALQNGMLTSTGSGPLQVVAQIDPSALHDAVNGNGNGVFAPGSTWLNGQTGSFWTCLDATAGAAVWDRLNDFVGLRNDRWYTGPYAQIPNAPGQLFWNAHLVRIARRATIAQVAVRVTTAGGAAARIAIGLYANLNGIPGARLHDFGTIAAGLDSIGPKSLAPTTTPAAAPFTVVDPGWYWMATQVDSGGGTMPAFQSANAAPQLNNDVGDASAGAVLGSATTHGSFTSSSALGGFGLPAMAPTLAHQSRVPLVAFGIAS